MACWDAVQDKWRYLTLIAGILMMLVSGAQFAYGEYSVALIQRMNYTETDNALIGSLINVGTYCSVPFSGLLYGQIASPYAPKVLVSFIIVCNLIAYFVAYACTTTLRLTTPSHGLAMVYFVMGMASATIITTSLVVNSRNYAPKHRGKVTGALTAAMGGGGFVFSLFYRAVDSIPNYLLLSGAFAFVIGVFGLIVMKETGTPISSGHQKLLESDLGEGLIAPAPPSPVLDVYGVQLLKQAAFWVALFSFCIGCGTSLMVGNNVDVIMRSVYSPVDPVILVTMNSVANIIGRVGVGIVGDYFLPRGVPRLLWVGIACLILALMDLLQALIGLSVYIVVPMVGFAFGVIMSCVLTMVGEKWGSPHQAINNGIFLFTVGVGSISFNEGFGRIYKLSSTVRASGESECYGLECFRTMFFIAAAFNFVCGLACFLILRREKHLQRRPVVRSDGYEDSRM